MAKSTNNLPERCMSCGYNGRVSTGSSNRRYCNYLGITGKCRGCSPEQCEHYKEDPEKVKEIKRKYINRSLQGIPYNHSFQTFKEV